MGGRYSALTASTGYLPPTGGNDSDRRGAWEDPNCAVVQLVWTTAAHSNGSDQKSDRDLFLVLVI